MSTTKPYKETLNLPVTRFDMKANLTVREPERQAKWREMDLYTKIRENRAGKTRRVLHDGPPYANGDIHMGHVLNKVLKDMVVRYLTLAGYDSPYVPGWDCHGLPIEHKVAKDLGSKIAGMDASEIRERCRVEALKWVDIQRKQFLRLGISGDWFNPYLTLDPRYESSIMDVLADLVAGGYVFRQLKPIHWDIHDRTALAEAELEYQDVTSPSVFVAFPIVAGVPTSFGPGEWSALIWTTTPWTLPANVAIAANEHLDYAGIRYTDPKTGATHQVILAADLAAKVMGLGGVSEYQEVARCKGRDLAGARYRHVFIDRESPIVMAQYVSAEDGTGLVHTAPGHGAEDYQTGQKYGLPTLSPVDDAGRFTDEAPAELVGKGVFQANPLVVEMVRSRGALFHEMPLHHSYPHGWRSKKPVIFRATHQWFISVEHNDLRKNTLAAIDQVTWLPSWGRSRIDAMVGNRPDWCISRQRNWGVPIPVLFNDQTGDHHLTAESVRFYRDLFRREGADAWFKKTAAELVPPDLNATRFPVESLRKGTDILDVWFESGSSHRAVLAQNFDLGYPAFMYLEGSDQHRGWFQSSILTAVGTTGRAPFETVLTHGFIVDEQGKKMAKTGGNAVSALKMTEQYGADVLRLYVASLDYADDIRMSERGIKEASESYRKIRNTFRYLLGNLEDYARFDPSTFDVTTLREIDLWALGQLNGVIRDVTASYDAFEFYKVYQRIYQFCAVDLSSFYLDVLKDRLYAELPDGPDRRAAQYVLARLHEVLTILLAPILPHTTDELWEFVPDREGKPASVHLAEWPEPDPRWEDATREARWTAIRSLRDVALTALEGMRKAKEIGSGQEASLEIMVPSDQAAGIDRSRLTTVLMVSEVTIVEADGLTAPIVKASKSPHPKCERCWNLRPTVGQDAEHPTLCDRCVRVIRALSSSPS
ncbi:MAG: isoleucyl-tRNA synthetase [Planctomycetota bacterium]|nr:isoleucyl-tRNA synthetase [Planctomycetota bacterium]